MSQHHAAVPASPLRRRMLHDMAMRGLHEDTQRNYIMSVRNFAAFLGRSPETATPEGVRRFQIHQADSGVQPPMVNNTVSGLRFLFNVTLDRPDLSRRLVLARYAQKLPTVLNVEEVGRLASETMVTIASDPRHLGARMGITAVLHTWGSALIHHPHVHMIVPGGGISLDGVKRHQEPIRWRHEEPIHPCYSDAPA